jgi:hypothetical protein
VLITLFAYIIECQTREFTLRNHQYSASVCAKSDFPIVPKLDYLVQYYISFLMMYSKLGHKLINVKTARINKLLFAFVNWVTLASIYIQQPFTPNLFSQLFANSTMLCSFSCSFQRCTENCGTSSQTSKSQGLISANYSVCISVIRFQTREFTVRKHQYSASVCAKSDFPVVPKLNYMV